MVSSSKETEKNPCCIKKRLIIIKIDALSARKLCQLEFVSLLLAIGMLAYKNMIINALTSKLAGRYYHIFAWLIAYAKYLFSSPSNAFPCRASSLAISCTVS